MILPLKCPECGSEIELNYNDSQLANEQQEEEMMKAFQELGIINLQVESINT